MSRIMNCNLYFLFEFVLLIPICSFQISSNAPILANLTNLAEKISPKESLDFSMQSTSSMGEIEVPPNTPTSANSEPNIAQKTPSFADIENELIKEAKKLEGNFKDHVEKDSTKKPVEAVKEISGIFFLLISYITFRSPFKYPVLH